MPTTRELLPQPFAWIEIPTGTVEPAKGGYIQKVGQVFEVPAFAIAQYPITNAHYAPFIAAGGYQQPRWWTEAGWEACRQGWAWESVAEWEPTHTAWVEPRYWHDRQFNIADHPVVGVSWYEAVAYCQWLSAVTGEYITLPTEQQWQHAAQGDDGRVYPWGENWDCHRCHNSVPPCNSNQTAPVTAYAGQHKGNSPYGVVEMAGNVREWCSTAYATGSEDLSGTYNRLLRGGSWFSKDAPSFRVDFRYWNAPHFWSSDVGFRCVRRGA